MRTTSRGFTLIELLVVIGLIAIGWAWIPQLLKPNATTTEATSAADLITQLTARARLEALTRQREVTFAIELNSTPIKIAVGVTNTNSSHTTLAEATLPPSYALDISRSSGAGTAGVLTLESRADSFWAIWPYTAEGKAKYTGGRIIFTAPNTAGLSYQIASEGALIKE